MKRDLGGAFVWSLEMDDFSGHCGEMKYPLLSTVHDNLSPTYDSDERPSEAGAKPPTSQKGKV